jgi:hypothetical protein
MPARKKPEPEIAALDEFEPDGTWEGLDELVDALAKKKLTAARMDALLRVFEKWPDVDGEELMPIVHVLEKTKGYDARLVASMKRTPSAYGALMINRMLNAGTKTVGTTNLLKLMQSAATREDASDGARSEIEGFLKHHGVTIKKKPASEAGASNAPRTIGVPAAESLIALGSLLSLQGDDPKFTEVVEAMGGNPRVQPSDQFGFVTLKKAGIEFRFKSDHSAGKKKSWVLTGIGVYSGGHERYAQYAGQLPGGLTFESTRAEVRKALGSPVKSGGGKIIGTLVRPEWDQFRLAKKCLATFSYFAENERICSASIALPRPEEK